MSEIDGNDSVPVVAVSAAAPPLLGVYFDRARAAFMIARGKEDGVRREDGACSS